MSIRSKMFEMTGRVANFLDITTGIVLLVFLGLVIADVSYNTSGNNKPSVTAAKDFFATFVLAAMSWNILQIRGGVYELYKKGIKEIPSGKYY